MMAIKKKNIYVNISRKIYCYIRCNRLGRSLSIAIVFLFIFVKGLKRIFNIFRNKNHKRKFDSTPNGERLKL